MSENAKSNTGRVRRPRTHMQFGPPGARPIVQPQTAQVQPVQPKPVQPTSVRQVETPNLRIVQE